MPDLNLQIDLTPPPEAESSDPLTITSQPGPDYHFTDLPPVYRPGGHVSGRVTITSPTGPWKADAIELLVFWRTSGIGTRDNGVGSSIALCQKNTEIPSHFTRDFQLQIPLQPYSYNGRLIKIDWFVGLRVKKGWLSKQELELPIEVRPEGMPSRFAVESPDIGASE